MQCPHCWADMPDNMKFCGACGESLAAAPCPACANVNPAGFKFCGHCGAPLPASPVSAGAEEGALVPPKRVGERRQLTALFCDIVDSTGIAERLDPEDLSDLIRRYRLLCAGVVQRFQGYIAQYQGDGLLAYFGYPQAREDSAERAVRAGLEIVELAPSLKAFPQSGEPITLAVRIGIATGLVVASDLRFEGNPEDKMVIGQTLNLAARLQNLAAPNTVVITPRLQRHLGGLFEYEDLGLHTLKGFPQPLRAWRALQPRRAATRFEALHRTGLPPLVNRSDELNALLRGWHSAREGRGRVIVMTGEPGIGKSRLLQALRERIAHEAYLRLLYQCSPYNTNSALYPFISHLEHAAHFNRRDTAEQKLDKLVKLLSRLPDSAPDKVAVVAALLSLPTGDRYPPLLLSPQRRKEKILQTLLDYLTGLAAAQPVLVLFEDIHWIDPTSSEALEALIPAVSRLRALFLVTCRPGPAPPWLTLPHVKQLELGRLESEHCLSLARQISAGGELSDHLLQQILVKTDGVPLFIEELTKTLLCAEPLQRRLAAARPHETGLAIPSTLQDSLLARLEQWGSAKAVAQAASVIGREFSYEMLAALAPAPEPQLQEGLQQLIDAGLAYCDGAPPQATYAFKHALVRDAAYDSLLRHPRQQLHARIAETLEQRFPDLAERQPELLAQHYSAAGLADKSLDYWIKAGRRACARSANQEAVTHFQTGLEVLHTLADSSWRREQELLLQINLGAALITTAGPGSPEVERAYARALELCSQLPESPLHFAAWWGWWRISGNFQTFRERADKLLSLAESLRDPGLRLQAHHCQWAVLFNLGDHLNCCQHIERGLAIYAQGDYRAQAAFYGGHDPAVCGHGEMALSLWLLGYPERALRHIEQALALARELPEAGSRAHALDIALMLHFYRRDLAAVQSQAAALGRFAEEQGFPDYLAKRRLFQGWATAVAGRPADGVAAVQAGVAALRDIGTKEDFPIFFDMLAEAYGLAGQPDRGLSELEAAFSEAEESGMRHWAAELYRRRGELLALLDPEHADAAAECFHKALVIARQQQARALELRAAVSLARLALAGRFPNGYDLLQAVYHRFSEGFDTPDLQEAHDVLQQLQQQAS